MRPFKIFLEIIALNHRDATGLSGIEAGISIWIKGSRRWRGKTLAKRFGLTNGWRMPIWGELAARADRGDFDDAIQDLNIAIDLNPEEQHSV